MFYTGYALMLVFKQKQPFLAFFENLSVLMFSTYGILDNPDIPEILDIPGIPDIPEIPGIPGMSGISVMPGIPNIPENPGILVIPNIPENQEFLVCKKPDIYWHKQIKVW